MTAIPHQLPRNAPAPTWRAAQALGVIATGALLVALVLQPETGLFILWNVLIPLVPLSLLVSPLIWRNVCPLATVNMLSNRSAATRRLTAAATAKVGGIAIALLVVLVPARRFLFNTDGLALAIVIAAVAAWALVLGAFFDTKAGFCNSICPVLPVERLYGQSPLLRVANARCATCTSCTQRGCIDLAPEKSIAQLLGGNRFGTAWLRTGFGAFAAAFPGFVVGYFTTTDVPLAEAGSVYLHVGLYAAISYLLVAAAVYLFRPSSGLVFVVLGAVAAALYYWFAVESILGAFGVAEPLWTLVGRSFMVLVIVLWLAEAVPRTLASREPAGGSAAHS